MTRVIPTALVALALVSPAVAQAPAPGATPTLGGLFESRQQGDNRPTEITARDGIEWDRTRQRYLARGDARVIRGDSVIQADTLMALYRQAPRPAEAGAAPRAADPAGERTTIYRYEAIGNVRVTTPTQTIVADRAVYDVAAGRIVLTGQNLRLSTPNETVTARESLEYHEPERRAVARGNAVIVTSDQRWLRADLLTAFLYAPNEPRPTRTGPRAGRGDGSLPVPGGNNQNLKRVELDGNVVIVTQSDTVRGARAVYDNQRGTAEVQGGAQITRGQNHLSGDRVEVNLETGIGRLLPNTDGRVRGLLTPGSTPAQPGPAQPAQPRR